MAQAGILSLFNKYENLRIFLIHTIPAFPTREFAPSSANLGYSLPFGWLNRFIWTFGERMLHDGANKPIIKDMCSKNNLIPMNLEKTFSDSILTLVDRPITVFNVYSSSLLPKPDDWPDNQHVVGFIRYNALD